MSATLAVSVDGVRRDPSDFLALVSERLGRGQRLVTMYGAPSTSPEAVEVTAVLLDQGALKVLRTRLERTRGYHAITAHFPAVHVFERELHETFGVELHGHPWLKPVRFPRGLAAGVATHPYYRLEGKDVHEVAVGPIHAGVIEPGHFRFQCLGEAVHHLEIQLGYQHRGVETLLPRAPLRHLAPVVETVAGDSSVAHAWACAGALEALAGLAPDEPTQVYRAVGLELERVAMHLAGLAGLATDVAFLQGASTYGRLRTTAINTSMLVCGSRFGRGWVKPGGAARGLPKALLSQVRENLALLRGDLAIINQHFVTALTVQQRLMGVGVVTREQALEVGLVGQAARASGVEIDLRAQVASSPWAQRPVPVVVEQSGDCWARAQVRLREMEASLQWLTVAVEGEAGLPALPLVPRALEPGRLAISLVEGWRGEVVHAVETDAEGRVAHYRVQDPSLRNWFGLALSVRHNDISDFPICNKSFDLSYCGSDL